jgi:hypothetical protein
MTARATIRRIWERPNGEWLVIVEPVGKLDRIVLRTYDAWLASLAERYMQYTGRPAVTITYDEMTKTLHAIAVPVNGG